MFFTEIYSFFSEPDVAKANLLTRNYALAIFFTGLGGGICQGLSTIAFAMSGEALTMRIRQISFQAMLRQEISWFDREDNSLGALVTRLSSDAASLKVQKTRTLFYLRFIENIRKPFLGSIWNACWHHF